MVILKMACAMVVYPRVCGGTSIICETDTPMLGLSPRMRGNHGVACAAASQQRSIPAYAGEPR